MPIETNLEPGQPWVFDREVAESFDAMLSRSIPQYETMRGLVFDFGAPFVTPQSDVLDLGCSRGEALAPFVRKFGAHNRFVGIDVAEPMLAAARETFASYPERVVRIERFDLRTGFPPVDASLILSVLTLMFTPINYRIRIVEDAYRHLRPGGALILVEKVLGESALTDRLIQSRYHQLKAEHGYSQEEIVRKAAALEGVQVPLLASGNEDLLRRAGFLTVECVWRWCNFAMWLAVKRGAAENERTLLGLAIPHVR
jgi:tRNA (cmo5U34)-methyltransferase